MVRVIRNVCGVVSLGVHIGSIAFFRILPHSSAFFSDLHRPIHIHTYTQSPNPFAIHDSRFTFHLSLRVSFIPIPIPL